MNAGQIELAKSYIAWMRGRNTLSLDGYYPGWENAARDGIGDDTCAPSIGRVERPTLRPHIVCPALQNRELPPPSSRNVRKPKFIVGSLRRRYKLNRKLTWRNTTKMA